MTDRTKLWIAEKMQELMVRKQISRIRVSELCRAAGIERSTFYYHFRDKYDLVAWIFLQAAFETDALDISSAAESMKKMKTDMLVYYRRAYEDASQNALWQYILEYFTDKYTEIAKEKLHTDTLSTQLLFSIRLYCYGAVWMTREWVLNDNVTSAETEIRMQYASMPEEMRRIFFPD